MLHCKFVIDIPWIQDTFKSIFSRSGVITKHKCWEIEITRFSENLFYFECDLHWRGRDHAGPEITIGLLSYVFSVKIYDNRHWDYTKGTWNI
jgi:hypothetical protein